MESPAKILEEIKTLLDIQLQGLQTFDSFYDMFDVNDTTDIGGCRTTLLEKSENHLRFRTHIPPGADSGFHKHWHDCKEVCTVIEGTIADVKLEHKYAKRGQKITYKAYEEHMPYNPGKIMLVVQVDFCRDK